MFKNTNRTTFARLGLILIAIFFISFTIFSNSFFRGKQLDLTEGKLFTLTDATRSILKSIDEPIKVRLFFSGILGAQSPNHGIYFARVRELLSQYENIAEGRLKLEIFDPKPFSDAEDLAVGFGLTGANINSAGDLGYFGLAATNSTDDEATIPFLTPAREMFLEYDLTKMIHTLVNPKKPTVGILTSLPINVGAGPRLGQPGRWAVVDQIEEFFEITPISRDAASIPNDVDILLIVHPKGLKKAMLYEIDQFVLNGGRALVFVDTNAEAAVRPGPANTNDPVSDFDSTLESWGVRLVKGKVAGDLQSARRVNVRQGQKMAVADYVVWLALKRANFDQADVVTGDIEAINVASSGILEPIGDKGTNFLPLIQTSEQSMQISRNKVISQPPDVIGLFRDFKSSGKPLTIAARITGKIQSGYPAGPPTESKRKKTNHLVESKEPINLIIVADTDILQDILWVEVQDLLGSKLFSPYANNADFVVSALDNLTGSQELISLRGRSRSSRDFELVKQIRQSAELRYRAKEQKLQAKLSEIREKLGQLTAQGQEQETSKINSKHKRTIDEFRGEMAEIRKELRSVQLALRQDIDSLDTWLKFVNIAGIPIVIVLGVMCFSVFRRSRDKRQLKVL